MRLLLLNMHFFLVAVIAIYLGMQYYLAWWVVRSFPGLPLSPYAIRLIILSIALSFPLSFYLLRRFPSPLTEVFGVVSLVWFGMSFLCLATAVASDVMLLAARWAGAPPQWRQIYAWGTLALMASLSLFSFWNALRPPLVKTVEVPLHNLPAALDGFSIALASDIHLGITLPFRHLERSVERINAMDADLVVFAGDIMDRGFRHQERSITLASSIRAKHGKYAVLGNHELYHGVAESVAWHERAGFDLLRGRTVVLPNGLQVAGVDDVRTARVTKEDMARLFSGLDAGKPSVFISHQPQVFDLAAAHGVGLTLSGHTHGGQIFPFHLLVKLANRYLYGLYEKNGSYLYVTQGTGYWGPPMRLLTRSEITRIVLKAPVAAK
ncbi:MAG: metallophosphoesterase [Elusimicrobiota bacterium]